MHHETKREIHKRRKQRGYNVSQFWQGHRCCRKLSPFSSNQSQVNISMDLIETQSCRLDGKCDFTIRQAQQYLTPTNQQLPQGLVKNPTMHVYYCKLSLLLIPHFKRAQAQQIKYDMIRYDLRYIKRQTPRYKNFCIQISRK